MIKQIIKGGIYKHYKGSFVEVLGFGKDTETLEDVVIYHHVIHKPPEIINWEDPKDKMIWVRPVKIWNETIEMYISQTATGTQSDIKYKVPRFKLVWDPNKS